MSEQHTPTPLDKSIATPGWFGFSAIAVLVIAFLARFIRLDGYLLNDREAHWAYDAWSMFYGRPLPIGEELPDSSPFMLLWNSVPFYLFGVTDATARVGSALLGVGLVGLVFALRPFLSKAQILAIAGILAISPTVVFSSRTIEPGIAAAFFAMLIIVTLLRISISHENRAGWAALFGIALASLYATGPLGVTTIIALAIGVIISGLQSTPGQISSNAVGMGLRSLVQDRETTLALLGGVIVGLVVLFSRAFTSLASLTGIGSTLTDWAEMLARGSSSIPVVFYFWSLMLYETIAVGIAIVTVIFYRTSTRSEEIGRRQLPTLLFISWFVAALVLHSASSGRDTNSAVLVVLPVLILAGLGLGSMLESAARNKGGRSALAAVATVVLLAYSLNAMIGLSFTRGESATEPLAQDVPAAEAGEFIDRIMRLSRDISVTEYSEADPTGQYSLTIMASPENEWPFTWYFRDFNQFSVVPVAGFTETTDVAIGDSAEVMDGVGLTTSNWNWQNRPNDPLTQMKSGDILSTAFNPANWDDAWNYMIHREAPAEVETETITVGYSVRVMNKLTTQSGPYDLFTSTPPGPGSGLGQLDTPTGIATAADGTIYVLNAGNARVDRYDQSGKFIGIWNGQIEQPLQLSWNGFQGGSALHFGPDGLLYIADTWNHAVVVVNQNGQVVRMLGNRGVQTDITDAGNPSDQPGLFFGPRDVAVTEDRIYVTDTGNERVQVFGMDGTFITAFGGFGEGEGQFIEPTGIAIAPDGTIWVADSGNARLQQFDADGAFLASYDVPDWSDQMGIDRLNMIDFDANGILYYTLPEGGVVAWKDGESAPLSNTVGILPGGLTFDDNGEMLVTNMENGDVIRFRPELPGEWTTPNGTPGATPASSPQATPET